MTELFALGRKRGIRSHRRRGRWKNPRFCRRGSPCKGSCRHRRLRGSPVSPPLSAKLTSPLLGEAKIRTHQKPPPSGAPPKPSRYGGFGGERRRCAVTELFALGRKRGIRSHRRRGRWKNPRFCRRGSPCKGSCRHRRLRGSNSFRRDTFAAPSGGEIIPTDH